MVSVIQGHLLFTIEVQDTGGQPDPPEAQGWRWYSHFQDYPADTQAKGWMHPVAFQSEHAAEYGFSRYELFLADWLVVVISAALPMFWMLGRVRRWRRLHTGRCAECGFDLTGNTSGVCPECGVTIARKAEA